MILEILLEDSAISPGFPSLADDNLDTVIEPNKELIKRKDSIFFGELKATSQESIKVDLHEIDMSLEPKS